MDKFILYSVLALFWGFVLWYVRREKNRAVAAQRAGIEQSLLACAAKHPFFDPATAVLVRHVEEDWASADGGEPKMQVNRIYRNLAGQYFLFMGVGDEPGYLTHLSRERAMNALRSTPLIYQAEFPDTCWRAMKNDQLSEVLRVQN